MIQYCLLLGRLHSAGVHGAWYSGLAYAVPGVQHMQRLSSSSFCPCCFSIFIMPGTTEMSLLYLLKYQEVIMSIVRLRNECVSWRKMACLSQGLPILPHTPRISVDLEKARPETPYKSSASQALQRCSGHCTPLDHNAKSAMNKYSSDSNSRIPLSFHLRIL